MSESEDPTPAPPRQVEAQGGEQDDPEEDEKSFTMEEELLLEMIRDRETQISMIQRKLEDQAQKLDRARKTLAETKLKATSETTEQQIEFEQLIQRHSKLSQQYKDSTDMLDMKKQQQGTHLHIYNETIKNVASPESRDSSYVMRMQAQLCKAMHSMGMTETQLAMATAQSEGTTKYLREVVTATVEEKSQVELQLMNGLVIADTARREVETKHKGMMDSFFKEKDALVAKIEAQQEADKDDDEDAEAEEEEKEELKEILSQGREEIERLETENKEGLEKLEDLKRKVAEVKGEGFVDELVTAISEEINARQDEQEESEGEESD